MTDSAQIESLKHLFYQCQFRKLLNVLETIDQGDSIVVRTPELAMLRANAHFELREVDKAIKVMEELVSASEDSYEEHYLYALARLSYLNNDMEGSYEICLDLIDSTQDDRLQFKALLCMANVLYSSDKNEELDAIVFDLKRFEPLEQLDERISLLLFLGNYYSRQTATADRAHEYYREAQRIAARENWSYFVCRAIYGRAVAYEKSNKTAEMAVTLDILKPFVDEDQCIFFSQLVNKRFNRCELETATTAQMEFDQDNRRIMLEGRWMPFHDKPLLYRFLEVLNDERSFVSKQSIAVRLWPDEDYRSRVHDPRIFDIAKRVRGLVQKCESEQFVLLSGRLGYKLSSA